MVPFEPVSAPKLMSLLDFIDIVVDDHITADNRNGHGSQP
jgi:hypothetical protein